MLKSEDEVLCFVREALSRNLPRQEIAKALEQAGWTPEQIRTALLAFADDLAFPIPVPRPRPYRSAQDVFVYSILFLALYASAFNVGALMFNVIDKAFPDALQNPFALRYLDDRIRWNIAAVLIAFPLFILVFRAVVRATVVDPTKRLSLPRKWLTYLTLFIASAALMGDTSVLVYSLLGGELTTHFVFKAVTVAIIAGGVFGFFLNDVRKEEEKEKKRVSGVFAALAGVVVLGAVAAGLMVIGSPSDIRMRRLDERRASDLAAIANGISTYRLSHESVPKTLDELIPFGLEGVLKDPEGQAYEYSVKSASSYELCAVFATVTDRLPESPIRSAFEKHGIGRQCFGREARAPTSR